MFEGDRTFSLRDLRRRDDFDEPTVSESVAPVHDPAPLAPAPVRPRTNTPFRGALDSQPVPTRQRPTSAPQGQADVVAGRYRLEEPIGVGGMGRVYRARHLQLDKVFALKLMKTDFAGDSAAREQFYREARVASSLSHPNIVSIVDFGEDPALGAFMVMELLEGEPVTVRLHTEGRFPLRLACEVILQIAEALQYIHNRQIVHCDIKADNILILPLPPATGAAWP